MQFAHIELLCLFSKELCGAISKTMFISELDSELYVLGAFIVFTICGICNVQKFIMKLICFRWYGILGMDDLAVKHMLEVLACSHQPKTTQELFLRDFLQIVQVIYILLIILFNFFSPLYLIDKLRTPFIEGKLGFSITLKGLRSLRYRKQEYPDRKMPLCRNLKLGIINSSLKSLFLYA